MEIKKLIFSNRYSFLILLLFTIPFNSEGQKAKPARVLSADEAKMVKKDASTLFATGDFNGALGAYQELIKTAPENSEYNYRLGICLLLTTFDKSAALPYLKLNAASTDPKKEIDYYLGLAYMYNVEWESAITSFLDYKNKHAGKPIKDMPSVDMLLGMCDNGKELCKHPVNVSFENMGKLINTSYDEYNPCISGDGKYLAFSSRRKGNIGGFIEELGMYTSDIYGTSWRDTIWTKAKSFGGLVNGEWDEELVGMSVNGDLALIYFDNLEFFADIGFTSIKGKSWTKTQMFNEAINSKQYEGAGCISLDGSTLIFSSGRKEGQGGIDLWMAKKDPNGIWGSVENLGAEINSKEDEDFPWLSLDGNTLYFASKGHNSMGDYDLFKSNRDALSGKWGEAINVGYPINNADDNHFISFTADGRFAYISSNRKGGFGGLDIWRVEYNDSTDHPFKTVITGKVVSESGARINLTKVTLENTLTQEVQDYRPAASGNNFILNAVPGAYKIIVEGSNFVSTSVGIIIDETFPPIEIQQDLTVQSSK